VSRAPRPPLAWTPVLAGGALIVLAVIGLLARPLLPVDETRYLAVAWSMWIHGDWLVPHLNGAAYADKPPLLFWLFHLGWALFGVNDWWPRLVPALFAAGSVALMAPLAQLLWPDAETGTARWTPAAAAPLILAACLLWSLYATLVMFDMVLAFFALLGVYALARAWRRGLARDWALLGVAIGLGVLAKGPVILLHILPLAILAPWWTGGTLGMSRTRWYVALAAAVLLGAALALAWALPAAQAGGPDYAHAIFWGQTADRMVDSFAHRRPWWWYLPLLPVFLFPWLLWPPLWRALVHWRAEQAAGDAGLWFCLAWVVPTFAAFSLISGKQPHYVLPLLPGFALLAARLLAPTVRQDRTAGGRWYDGVPVALVLAALGGALIAVTTRAGPGGGAPWGPDWIGRISPGWGVLLIAAGLAVVLVARVPRASQVRVLAPLSALLVATFYVGLMHPVYARYDLRPAAREIGALQRQGNAVAQVGAYYGEYQFLGRLRHPLTVLRPAQASAWVRAHPTGFVVVYYSHGLPRAAPAPVYSQPYRTRTLAIWPAAVLAARPQLLNAS